MCSLVGCRRCADNYWPIPAVLPFPRFFGMSIIATQSDSMMGLNGLNPWILVSYRVILFTSKLVSGYKTFLTPSRNHTNWVSVSATKTTTIYDKK